MQQNEKIKSIISQVIKEGRENSERIAEETKKNIENELRKSEDQILSETYDMIKTRSAKINAASGTAVTKAETEARNKLFERRHEIMFEVFDEVIVKIKDFTKSDEYKEFLINSAKKIVVDCGECRKISFREEDLKYSTEVAKILGKSVTIETDNNIKLGGFYAYTLDKCNVIDNTLDERLEEQKSWFINNSGLTIL